MNSKIYSMIHAWEADSAPQCQHMHAISLKEKEK